MACRDKMCAFPASEGRGMGSALNRQIDSSAETLSLRALAMLGIMLHNFCHWLPGIVDENEFEFHAGNFENLQTALIHQTIFN